MEAKYRRVVLKLSGEALAGDQGFGINPDVVEEIAAQITALMLRLLSGAAIYGVGLQAARRGWIARLRITWA